MHDKSRMAGVPTSQSNAPAGSAAILSPGHAYTSRYPSVLHGAASLPLSSKLFLFSTTRLFLHRPWKIWFLLKVSGNAGAFCSALNVGPLSSDLDTSSCKKSDEGWVSQTHYLFAPLAWCPKFLPEHDHKHTLAETFNHTPATSN